MKKLTSIIIQSAIVCGAMLVSSSFCYATAVVAQVAAHDAEIVKKVAVSTSKIAVVDIQKVIQSSPQMKEIQKKLESNFKIRRENIVSAESALKSDMDKFKRESTVLSDKQKKELEKTIITKQQALQRDGEKYQQDLTAYQNELMEDFYNKIRKTIQVVAAKNQYEIVLQKDAVPYSVPQLDITAQVLQALKA